MKRSLLVISFVLMGLVVSCAPPVSSGGHAGAGERKVASHQQTFAAPADTSTFTQTGTQTSVDTPDTTQAATHTPTQTPIATPTITLTSTSTSIPASTSAIRVTPTTTGAPAPGTASASTSLATSGDSGSSRELVEYGLEVYRQQYCGLCHQLDAADSGGRFGPIHDGMGTIAEQRIQDPGYTGAAQTAAEYVRESIVSPQSYIAEGYEYTQHHMPAYVHLSEEDIDALVHMLLQQK